VCCFLLFGALAEFGLSHLRTILQHLFQRERPFPEPLRQGLPFHAFHHQIIDSILMTHVVQNANVRMIQAGNRFGFPLEPLLPTGSQENCAGRILMATVRSSRVSRAR